MDEPPIIGACSEGDDRANAVSTATGAAIFGATLPLIGNPLYDFWSKYPKPAAFTISLSYTL